MITPTLFLGIFRRHFCVTRETLRYIVGQLKTHRHYQSTPFRVQTLAPEASGRLTTGMPIRELAISHSSVVAFLDRFLTAMIDAFHDIIRWPQGDKVARIANGFANC